MINLSDLENYFQKLLFGEHTLDVQKIDPIMTNGLMVRGKEKIEKIGFGVSASISLFEKAHESSCDALVVHHSFNFPPINTYDPIFQKRISYLLKHELSLFGFHFVLDQDKEIGNNAMILKTLGAQPTVPYLYHGDPWGWVGEFEKNKSFDEVKECFAGYISPRSVFYNYGNHKIKKVVALSGKGAPSPDDMKLLLQNGVDLYITGEVHEWNRELCKEAGISLIAGGHYHTEVFGVKALMNKTNAQFTDISTTFLDLVNDI